MTRPVRFLPEAAAELEDAARWYEERRAALGLALIAAVDQAVASLARWPDAGVLVDGLPSDLPVRRVPVARFPYYVAYLASPEVVHVLAVAHERRRPAYWSGRAEA